MSEAMISGWDPLPLNQWDGDMTAAVEEIHRVGLQILEKHQTVSDRAAEVSNHWKLSERQEAEHEALQKLLDAVRAVSASLNTIFETGSPAAMAAATDTINTNLPVIEKSFITIRHAALDLLRWTRRDGHLEGSTLPEQYRASYAALVAYTPQFRPRIIQLLDDLLDLVQQEGADAAVQQLLTALTRYHGVLDTARGFVQAVVDPPLELTFQETQGLLDEWQQLDVSVRSALGTELNDVCQFLLYDKEKFNAGVEEIHHQVSEGLDASLMAIEAEGHKVLFSVDEDPLFHQLAVTLYRAVPSDTFESTCEELFDRLYHELR